MSTVPHSASELYEIVATGNGQDVLDAVEAMTATHGEFLTGIMMRSALNAADAEAGADWVWEYSTLDGATVYDTEVFWDLESLKKAVDVSFADYTWEEVERRGTFGTSVLVNRNGRYVGTGHWVYRKPACPTATHVGNSVQPDPVYCPACDRLHPGQAITPTANDSRS